MSRKWMKMVITIIALVTLAGVSVRADENDLVWATFLGGSDSDYAQDIYIDNSGSVYLTGQTYSNDFPVTSGVLDSAYNNVDAFVAKISASGAGLLYASYLGGIATENGYGIAVDASGKAYVTGLTWSTNFPTTDTAFDTSFNGQIDVFVIKLNATGSALEYSTYIGGDLFDQGLDLAIDESGRAYVTGTTGSTNFPYTSGAYDTTFNAGDAFAVRLDTSGTDLEYSTFLGGTSADEGYSIAVDDSNNAYVTGGTESNDYPTTTGAYDESHNGDYDVFITKLNSTGSDLVYSSFLGGELSDYGHGIAIDGMYAAYITGWTFFSESFPFPTTSGAYDTTHNGDSDAFSAKLSASGNSLEYSTFLGGDNSDIGYDIALDDLYHAHVTGETYSTDFPTTPDAFDTTLGSSGDADAFFVKLSATGDALGYGTFLGGDNDAEIGYGIFQTATGYTYITGETYSDDFPVTNSAYDTTFEGGDAFVAKFGTIDTTAPQPIDDLSIEIEGPKSKGDDLRLRWSAPSDDVGVTRYIVYRDTTAGAASDSLADTADTTYLDTGATGDASANYVYTVKAVDAADNKSEESNKVGEYDFSLKTTTGTDYTWVVYVFGTAGLDSASDLEAHIEANSFPATNCYTVSEWNAVAQSYTNYTTIPVPAGNFPLRPGHPYRVEVSTDAVWTMLGDVLPLDSLSFELKTTAGTDYTWISIPLQLASVDSASDLEAHIEANSSGATNCYSISQWNPTAQAYTSYTTIPVPAGNYGVSVGQACRVEISADVSWPSSGGLLKNERRWSER